MTRSDSVPDGLAARMWYKAETQRRADLEKMESTRLSKNEAKALKDARKNARGSEN